jgi:hypothetical protein
VIDTAKRGHLAFVTGNTYQIAILNKLLPPGFKIELEESVKKNYEAKQAALRKAALAPKKKKVIAPVSTATTSAVVTQLPSASTASTHLKKMPTTLSGAAIGVGIDTTGEEMHEAHIHKIAGKAPVSATNIPISKAPQAASPQHSGLNKAASVTS